MFTTPSVPDVPIFTPLPAAGPIDRLPLGADLRREQLHGERTRLAIELAAARDEWDRLDDNPGSFLRRTAVAETIARLQRELAAVDRDLKIGEQLASLARDLETEALDLERQRDEQIDAVLRVIDAPSVDQLRQIWTLSREVHDLNLAIAQATGVERKFFDGVRFVERVLRERLDAAKEALVRVSTPTSQPVMPGRAWRQTIARIHSLASQR